MVTRGIREYISRDWQSARDSKDDYWAERIARLGPAEGLRIAGELRDQVLAVNPGWPSADERHADVACHARLAELFRRADSARRR